MHIVGNQFLLKLVRLESKERNILDGNTAPTSIECIADVAAGPPRVADAAAPPPALGSRCSFAPHITADALMLYISALYSLIYLTACLWSLEFN
jgi:hypothetical protein